ncbi:MAG: hypothetical protein IRY97_07840 [Thermomicrobiaceae bacterium]|nr:hypothetical protein [Thermomicrobiaceae bacterium]
MRVILTPIDVAVVESIQRDRLRAAEQARLLASLSASPSGWSRLRGGVGTRLIRAGVWVAGRPGGDPGWRGERLSPVQ